MTVFIPRETIGRSMQSLKSIATYTIIVYLSLVCAEGLFSLYSVQYFFRPEWDEAKIRRQQDEDIKRAFLKSNPEYSGLVPKKLFKRTGAKLVRKHSFLPLGHGVPNSPLIYCNEGYGFLKYTTDRYGFHNDDAVWETERPWLLIGDSFATGACVPTEHNIASRLMEASGSTVINLGSPGQGPDVYTALARVFIALTRPQKVALVFYENDFDAPDRSIYSSETELFSPYLNVEFREATKAFYDEVREFVDAERSRFVAGQKSTLEKTRRPLSKVLKRVLSLKEIRKAILHGDETYNYVQLAIETTVQECAKFDPECDIYVVYISPSQYFRPRPKRVVQAQVSYLRKVIAGIERPITLVDLSDSLERSSYAPKGPHLSIEGYRLVADRILAQAD